MPFNEDGTRKTMAYKKGPFTMKGSPMQRNFGVSPAKLTDAEKAANLAKHAEKGKDDPNYWKEVKKTTGADVVTYKGKEY